MFSPLVDYLLAVAILFALTGWFLWWSMTRTHELTPQQLAEWQELEQLVLERKAEAVADCLFELGLPQLEEKTKRLEIARRLCIALFVS